MLRVVMDRLWYRAKTGWGIPAGPVTVRVRASRTQRLSRQRLLVGEAIDEAQTSAPETALIVGVGPGIGAALARHLAAQGMAVALAARNTEKLLPLVRNLADDGHRAAAYPCDACSEASVDRLRQDMQRDLASPPSLVVYNCEGFGPGGILDITPHAFEDAWRVNCLGAFLVARAVIPAMVERGHGTLIFTGPTGSLRGRAGYINLAVGKAGARMLAQSLARELGPQGIHVAHVVVDGPVRTPTNLENEYPQGPRRLIRPEAIAATLWHLHRQSPDCWTHELDLRSCVEPF